MAKPIDLELKKAFVDLQTQMMETSKKLHVIDGQIEVLKRAILHLNITQNKIKDLPPETQTYESIGRMFVLKNVDTIKSNLSSREIQLQTRTLGLMTKRKLLEDSLKESEDNIREMVQQRKDQIETKVE